MNDVRRRALRAMVWSLIVLAPINVYLWAVDYRAAPFPEHGTPFFVALMTPPLLVLVRSAKVFFSRD